MIERRYKLIENLGGLEFYDLMLDPMELFPLSQSGPDFNRLNALLGALPRLPGPKMPGLAGLDGNL